MVVTDRAGLWRAFVVFALGSVAQGIPFAIVAVHVSQGEHGPRWVAAVALARLAPYLLCSAIGGAVAARRSARRVFVTSSFARATVAVSLWIALHLDLPAAVLVALLFALVSLGTPTYPALMCVVHDSTSGATRRRGVAVAAGFESAAFWIGPAVGGLLLATAVGGALPLCAAMLVVAAVLSDRLDDGGRVAAVHSPSALIGRAARSLLRTGTRAAVVAVLAVNVLIGLVGVLLVDLADELGGSRERVFGALTLSQGLGAALVLVALAGPLHLHHRPRVPLACAAAASVALAASGGLSVALIACVVFGAAALSSEVVVSAAASEHLPATEIGPAIGLLDSWMVLAMALGTVAAPPLASLAGPRGALAVASAAAATGLFACTRAVRPAAGQLVGGLSGASEPRGLAPDATV